MLRRVVFKGRMKGGISLRFFVLLGVILTDPRGIGQLLKNVLTSWKSYCNKVEVET